jgi:hypothetical protein
VLGFVKSIPIYEPVFTYAATAGIGPYNTSLTQPGVQSISTTASIFSEYYSDLFQRDFVYPLSPLISCPTCKSYLFVGEFGFIQPNPVNFANISTANSVLIHQLQGLQVDMSVLSSGEVETSDCKIWASDVGAIQICIAKSTASPNALVAGNCLR